jgi:hypothetical protein
MPTRLSWAAFAFIGIAILAGAFSKVDFHSIGAILAAVVVGATGLAGLCNHPPWLPPAEPPAEPPANLVIDPPPPPPAAQPSHQAGQ